MTDSDTEEMPSSPARMVREVAVCREIPRPTGWKYPPTTPPLKDLTCNELAVAIERSLDYMWKRRACCPSVNPTETIKIKIEKDVYKSKLKRKREFAKASIVFSDSRGESKQQKRDTKDRTDDDISD